MEKIHFSPIFACKKRCVQYIEQHIIMEKGDLQPLQKQLKNLIKSAIIKTNFLGIEVRPSEKNECANRFVCLFFSVAVAVLCVLLQAWKRRALCMFTI